MGVFLFEIIAILAFLKWADWSRNQELFAVIATGIFLRFLEHYILIDWLQVWKIQGPDFWSLFLPLSADLTFWPVVCYLYVQYIPKKWVWLYGGMWVGAMLIYLQSLIWMSVFTMEKFWNLGWSAATLSVYFLLLFLIWRWLSQGLQKKVEVIPER